MIITGSLLTTFEGTIFFEAEKIGPSLKSNLHSRKAWPNPLIAEYSIEL
jgi:hypothetical protein